MSLSAARFARVSVLAGFLAVVPFVGTAMADSITLTTAQNPLGIGFNQGFYTSSGGHDPASSLTTTTLTQRSFFIFDLSLIGDSIIENATLKINNPTNTSGTIQLWDVADPSSVKTGSGTTNYNDLGGGAAFGPVPLATFSGFGLLSFGLNPFAIAAMNQQAAMNLPHEYFGIGAKVTSFTLGTTAFGSAQAAQLVLTTKAAPVPDSGTTLGLFGLAGAALAVLRRRL